MKTHLICLLILCSHLASAQIVFEPEGKLPKKEKSDESKIRLGLSSQLVLYQFYSLDKVLISLNVYRKNFALNLGPAIYLNTFKYFIPTDMTFKRYGYNVALRYIFPQNKGDAKAFVPLEFSHTITLKNQSGYYDHVLATSGPGGLPNPGYSFNYTDKSNMNTFSIKSGVGLYIWLHEHFNVELQLALGTSFFKGKTDYYNADSGDLLVSYNTVISEEQAPILLEFSVGFGYRF
jgi:hypothetical protein